MNVDDDGKNCSAVEKLRRLHQTAIEKRDCDLKNYLVELFSSVENGQIELVIELRKLLSIYDDRAALKVEFIQADCLRSIEVLLDKSLDQQEKLVEIFRFLIELLVDSENVYEKFIELGIFERVFSKLKFIRSPPIEFVNKLLLLLTDRPKSTESETTLSPIDLFRNFIHPHLANVLIEWIPHLAQANLRHRLIESIQILVSRSLENKMTACSNRLISSLIRLLNDDNTSRIIDDQILFDGIFSILEKLSRFSISSQEIREILRLFNEQSSYRKQILRVLLTASKHDDSQTNLISSYFDLQRSNSGIVLPQIRRWPSLSSSSHFTFHCWIRLNTDIELVPINVRRQIYAFHSDSFGLEAFLYQSSIVVTVSDRRDLSSVQLDDCEDFTDGHWHSLTIVHTAQRPSLFAAAFQSISNCHLSIYIDGLLRKQVKDFKYFSLINESMHLASIGSPIYRSSSKTDSFHLSSTFSKTMQPFKGLFSAKSKSTTHRQDQNSTNNELNNRDHLFGQSISLHGQFASIWILAETLQDNQVRHLHSLGPDFLHQTQTVNQDEISLTLFDYVSTRSVALYHPLASNGLVSLDISTVHSQMNARLNNVSSFRVHSFVESLLNLGDCSLIYRLFGHFNEQDYSQLPNIENSLSFDMNSNDWILVRSQSQINNSDIDQKFLNNPIASILTLVRSILTSKPIKRLSEQNTHYFHTELLGYHLNQLASVFVDQQLLIAIQQLIESTRLSPSFQIIHNQLIQHVLLEFSFWSKAKYSVRIAHLQYVSALIKDEKKFYRNKFGVQFFLDTLRQYFNDESHDELKQLRGAIYSILKYYLQRNPRLDEINSLLSTVDSLSTSNDIITRELLEFLYNLLDPPSISTDTTIGLLCEPLMSEHLYTLLTIRTLTAETKEVIMKIMKNLVNSKRVPQQVRSQLRLEANNIGFGGIISGLMPDELNVNIVRDIFNLILTSDSAMVIDHLNVVLTLCSEASFDVRYVAMRKLMTCFIANPTICRSFSKCNGWQETLAHFLVKSRRTQSSAALVDQSASFNVSSDVLTYSMKDHSEDSGRGSSRGTSIHHSDLQKPMSNLPKVFETSSSPDDPTQERVVRSLDLSPIIDEIQHPTLSRTFSSPRPSISSNSILLTGNSILMDSKDTTPEFIRRNSDDFQQDLATPPRSSSTSREDLSLLTKSESVVKTERIDDASIIIPTFSSRDDGSLLDELGETLILTMVMILWKGIVGHDNDAWILRGQLISAIHYLERDFQFILPFAHVERRILELSIETCLNELKLNGGKSSVSYESNCREMIKLIDDFLSRSNENNEQLSEDFVQSIISLLDSLMIFEENGNNDPTTSSLVSHDEHWTETSLTGLNILLKLLEHPNSVYCGLASVRIHSLLHSRPITGREEAAFLLSNLNRICNTVDSSSKENDHFAYLLPLMKTIIDKSYTILQMNVQIPNVPLHKATATAWDDFLHYSSSADSQEWKNFIQRHVEPLAEHYRSMSIRPFQMNMKIWWNTCHEMMMIGIHKRNRQIGEEKLLFQSSIVDQWRARRRSDHQRLIKLAKQRRINKTRIEHLWRDCQRYLLNERGPWYDERARNSRHWMLSDRENIHRMRCKLIENDDFDGHTEASRLRDNLGTAEPVEQSRNNLIEQSLQYKSLVVQHDNLHINPIDEQELIDETNENQLLLLEEQEKIIIGTHCSLITLISTIEGKLEITNKYIYFFDSSSQKSHQNDFKYPLSWLQDVQLRRYNLRPSALEFFLLNQTNFLINFDKKVRRQVYQKILSLKLPSMKRLYTSQSVNMTPAEILRESKLTDKWVLREISNFDYLMMLNTIAGRTYNDLNQYPIFPWVLKEYSSNALNLNDPTIYRDFSRPIAIQNSKHIDDVRLKYETFDDPTGLMKKFHYGTHYSNAANVMHYLIRMEPFTTLHIQLQSGKFDIADRQFHSFQSTWSNILDSPNDGKELIPEFFFLPEFLENSNQFDLGKLQITNQRVSDVQLPPWAHNSPEEFIRLHRLALESDYVSSNLHHWIDLIFGYKQTGQAAVDALNVFMYCSYENAVDLDTIEDPITREAIEGMIQNFGQIPSQLLTEPHPQRLTRLQVTFQNESNGRPLNMLENLTHIRAFFVEITPADEKLCDPITYISIPKNQIRSFMQQGIPDTLITISINGVVGNNGWQPYDKSLSNFFTFERDPTLQTERNRHILAAPFSPSIQITSRLFTVSHDAKFVFSGGHWDCSLRVYSLIKSKMITSIIYHQDIVTCLALDSTGHILVTGSRDTTCVIWQLSLGENRSVPGAPIEQETVSFLRPTLTLYGHTAEVTSVAVSVELDLVLSGSVDGTCNIHTVEHGVYLRCLKPPIGHPVVNLKLSDERHIVIQTEQNETHLFLYSINGRLIRNKKLEFPVVDMLLADHHIILAVNHSHSNEHGQHSIVARIVIKDMFEMKTVQTIRLRTQINCLYFTKDNSHLLVGVKDGKLIVLTAEKKSSSKHSVKHST